MGLHLLGALAAINFYTINDKPDEISLMSRFCRQTYAVCRPMAVLLRMNNLECFRTIARH
jgi:hypothetical protein